MATEKDDVWVTLFAYALTVIQPVEENQEVLEAIDQYLEANVKAEAQNKENKDGKDGNEKK